MRSSPDTGPPRRSLVRLFSFAAYLGAVSLPAPNGIVGAVIALVAIYLPSFLLVLGALAVWEPLRRSTSLRRALSGVNAAVVGLLAATLYDPLWTTSVADVRDVLVVGIGVVAIASQRIPQVVVVLADGGVRSAVRPVKAAAASACINAVAGPAGTRHREPVIRCVGLSGRGSIFERSQRTWTSTVRGSPSWSIPQTRSSSCRRV